MNYIYYLVQRAKEPSTWSAVAVLAGAVGYQLNVDNALAYASAVFVLINIFWKKDTQVTGTGDGSS